MKEQYIKQVEKELSLPRKMKKEVVRDLNEVFASAMEHGETEQQIIQRLGTPKEFADSTAEQFGIDNTKSKKGTVSFLLLLRLLSRLLPFRYMLLRNQEKYQKEQSDKQTRQQIYRLRARLPLIFRKSFGYWVCSNSYCCFVNYPNHTQKQEVTNEKYISVFTIMVMIFWLRVLIKIHHLHRQAMRTIRNLIVLQNWTRVFGLRMSTQRGFLLRLVRLHGLHLIQNMRIAISTLLTLAKTTITSIWSF